MKKISIALALIAALVGCTKQNSDPKVGKLEVVMDIESISEDILDYFNVEFSYTDFNGTVRVKSIDGPEKFTFSINNPTIGEDYSNPFTVELKYTQRSTGGKTSGTYDATQKWQLNLNAYDQNGKLITDSGKVQSYSSNVQYANDKFNSFANEVTNQAKMRSITYRVCYCKTLSGEWHISYQGSYN